MVGGNKHRSVVKRLRREEYYGIAGVVVNRVRGRGGTVLYGNVSAPLPPCLRRGRL